MVEKKYKNQQALSECSNNECPSRAGQIKAKDDEVNASEKKIIIPSEARASAEKKATEKNTPQKPVAKLTSQAKAEATKISQKAGKTSKSDAASLKAVAPKKSVTKTKSAAVKNKPKAK